MPDSRIAIALLVLLGATSCKSVTDLGSGSGRTCAGGIVGAANAPFIRRGFCSPTLIDLRFAPNVPDSCAAPADQNWVAMFSTDDGNFSCARLDPISGVEHDSLSRVDFPGAMRVKTYFYSARRAAGTPHAGEDATVVLSLLDTGSIEVRIIDGDGGAGMGADCTPASARESEGLFGFFALECR